MNPLHLRLITIASLTLTLIILLNQNWIASAQHQPPTPQSRTPLSRKPANQPAQGLIYDGLDVAQTGDCVGMFRVQGTQLCTHGPDEPPPGYAVFKPVAAPQIPQHDIVCDNQLNNGQRIQVLYVRPSDRPDRYASQEDSIRHWAEHVDELYSLSAQTTGGERRIRFVTRQLNGKCVPDVGNVVLTASGDDTFSNTIQQLQAKGYNKRDRKYLIFMDATVLCGIGTTYDIDDPSLLNINNRVTSYARLDAGCWSSNVAAHELGHMLGAVMTSAPNSNGAGHCIDEYDLMCYNDSPNNPQTVIVCADPLNDQRLDCNHDDYFHTNPPPNNYLANHWNVANSSFLIGAPPAPPNAPANLVIQPPTRNSISLQWEAVFGATVYNIYRYDGWNFTWFAQTATPLFRDGDVRCESTAYYKITALNAAGESETSDMIYGTTNACSTPDDFEVDDTLENAKQLVPDQGQMHAISPEGDQDWVTFVVSDDMTLVLETSGQPIYDTILSLKNSNGTDIEINDDYTIDNDYSRIDRVCGVDSLPAGRYYAVVSEYDNTAEIKDYMLQLHLAPCHPEPTATPTATNTPTTTNTVVPTSTATSTATSTSVATTTASPTSTATSTATSTSVATTTASPTSTATSTPTSTQAPQPKHFVYVPLVQSR